MRVWFLILLFSGCCYADNSTDHFDPAGPFSFSFGNISVQRDLAVGDVISSVTVNSANELYTAGDTKFRLVMTYMGNAASGSDSCVVSTNVAGVGIKFVDSTNHGSACAGSAPGNFIDYTMGGGGYTVYNGTAYLIKTGNITPGTLDGGEVARAESVVNSTGEVSASETFNLTGTNSITQLACTVTTASLAFPIGSVPADQFMSVGTVSQQTSTQNLGLNCDAGANINVTLNGTQNPDSTDPSILALSSEANHATGVGVQLLYGGTPLELNKLLNLKTSSGGQETFPITARYIQTKDSVTAGSANATATLNITYQ